MAKLTGLVIMKDGQVVGAVQEDGFYTEDPDLTKLLQGIFDGEGAEQWELSETETATGDIIKHVKPGEEGFYPAFRDTLAGEGYVLAMARMGG